MPQPRNLKVRLTMPTEQYQSVTGAYLIAGGDGIITIDPANNPGDLAQLILLDSVLISPATPTNGADLVNGKGVSTTRCLGW